MSKRLSQEEFENCCRLVHGHAYDYSRSIYTVRMVDVEIICHEHGTIFFQKAGTHMLGQSSCWMCTVAKKAATRVLNAAEGKRNGTKHCRTCCKVLPVEQFIGNKWGAGGVYSVCKTCCKVRSDIALKAVRDCPSRSAMKKARAAEYTRNNREAANMKSALRRANRLSRTPPWIDVEFEGLFLAEIYHLTKLRQASSGFKWQVDHVVPFISETVCGFHCSDNMQIIPAFDNLSKGNKYWPDMP